MYKHTVLTVAFAFLTGCGQASRPSEPDKSIDLSTVIEKQNPLKQREGELVVTFGDENDRIVILGQRKTVAMVTDLLIHLSNAQRDQNSIDLDAIVKDVLSTHSGSQAF